VEEAFTCPFCGREGRRVMKDQGNIVVYECSLCGGIVAAYLKELHEHLKIAFKRPKLNSFKPTPPEWVKPLRGGGNEHS
jgi:uncharacterized Zn finger protein